MASGSHLGTRGPESSGDSLSGNRSTATSGAHDMLSLRHQPLAALLHRVIDVSVAEYVKAQDVDLAARVAEEC